MVVTEAKRGNLKAQYYAAISGIAHAVYNRIL